MGISKKTFQRISQEVEKFRQKIVSIACEDQNSEQVYRLNLQLFPLTKRKEANHE